MSNRETVFAAGEMVLVRLGPATGSDWQRARVLSSCEEWVRVRWPDGASERFKKGRCRRLKPATPPDSDPTRLGRER